MITNTQIKLMGTRERASGLDFSGVLEEDVESALKEAAQISMGTEISNEDLDNIQALSDQVRWGWVYKMQMQLHLIRRQAPALAPMVPLLLAAAHKQSCLQTPLRSLSSLSTAASCLTTSRAAWPRSRPTSR